MILLKKNKVKPKSARKYFAQANKDWEHGLYGDEKPEMVREIVGMKENKKSRALEFFKLMNIINENGWGISEDDALEMLALTAKKIKQTISWMYARFTTLEMVQ